MKLVALFVFVCVVAGDACGDYFVGMTEVRIQPQFGRVLISREIIRGQPYVDWAVACRDDLAKKGMFVDACRGDGTIVNTIEGSVDGQHFEITVTTHHLRTTGPGSAIPYKSLVVKIDGIKRWDTLFGWNRFQSLDFVFIHAHTRMIEYWFVDEFDCVDGDCQLPQRHMFYDDWPVDKCITIEDIHAKRITPPARQSPTCSQTSLATQSERRATDVSRRTWL